MGLKAGIFFFFLRFLHRHMQRCDWTVLAANSSCFSFLGSFPFSCWSSGFFSFPFFCFLFFFPSVFLLGDLLGTYMLRVIGSGVLRSRGYTCTTYWHLIRFLSDTHGLHTTTTNNQLMQKSEFRSFQSMIHHCDFLIYRVLVTLIYRKTKYKIR